MQRPTYNPAVDWNSTGAIVGIVADLIYMITTVKKPQFVPDNWHAPLSFVFLWVVSIFVSATAYLVWFPNFRPAQVDLFLYAVLILPNLIWLLKFSPQTQWGYLLMVAVICTYLQPLFTCLLLSYYGFL